MKIRTINVQHFKAVENTKSLKLGDITAFVGYNGTGKSSVIEACEFFQNYALGGIEHAISPWYAFEHILWKRIERRDFGKGVFKKRPLHIEISGKEGGKPCKLALEIGEKNVSEDPNEADETGVKWAYVKTASKEFSYSHEDTKPAESSPTNPEHIRFQTPEDLFRLNQVKELFRKWQFLNLSPQEIGQPRRRSLVHGKEPLHKSGAYLAEMLTSFLKKDSDGFNAMIEALHYVIPYASNIRADISKDIVEKRSIIRMVESVSKDYSMTLPAWVLSGGTLRLLTLLTVLRHPIEPEVIFIEEPENGLDPRAIGFLIEEISNATKYGGKQVILSTHSPYLLDKLALEHIITVERPDGGSPIFRRPSDDAELAQWAQKFAPGSLYTMGMLRDKERRSR